MKVELVVEGRRFPADPSKFALAFAQRCADESQRTVTVYEQAPGAAKMQREQVRPHLFDASVKL